MEKDVKNMILLKARIGFNGDTDKLIKTAVEKLEVTLPEDKTSLCPCCRKKGLLSVSTTDADISGTTVKNVPVWKCECGEIICGGRIFAEIEAILNGTEGKVIEFEDLLKSS